MRIAGFEINTKMCDYFWSSGTKLITMAKVGDYFHWLDDLRELLAGPCSKYKFKKNSTTIVSD